MARADVSLASDMQSMREGSLFKPHGCRVLGSQLKGDRRIRTYTLFKGLQKWALPSDPDATRQALLEVFEGRASCIWKSIQFCDDEAIDHRSMFVPLSASTGPCRRRDPHRRRGQLMMPFDDSGLLDELEA